MFNNINLCSQAVGHLQLLLAVRHKPQHLRIVVVVVVAVRPPISHHPPPNTHRPQPPTHPTRGHLDGGCGALKCLLPLPLPLLLHFPNLYARCANENLRGNATAHCFVAAAATLRNK